MNQYIQIIIEMLCILFYKQSLRNLIYTQSLSLFQLASFQVFNTSIASADLEYIGLWHHEDKVTLLCLTYIWCKQFQSFMGILTVIWLAKFKSKENNNRNYKNKTWLWSFWKIIFYFQLIKNIIELRNTVENIFSLSLVGQ